MFPPDKTIFLYSSCFISLSHFSIALKHASTIGSLDSFSFIILGLKILSGHFINSSSKYILLLSGNVYWEGLT